MKHLEHTHDLRLPEWGPYTKKYAGISHITDAARGYRFDLSVFPGFYRRKVDVPNVMWESGFHPWDAEPDLSRYTYRHQLEWKDQVYADITYSTVCAQSRLITCDCVNQTDDPQNLVLHLMASLHLPQVSGHGEPLLPDQPELPGDARWIDALDYCDLVWHQPRPDDALVYDGWRRGEVRRSGFVGGSGLGRGFGETAGDRAVYTLADVPAWEAGTLLVRCHLPHSEQAQLSIRLGDFHQHLTITGGSAAVTLARCDLGSLQGGDLTLEIASLGGSLILDGFVLVRTPEADEVQFSPVRVETTPDLHSEAGAQHLVLHYPGTTLYYGIAWSYSNYEVRSFHTSELDRFMRHYVHEHVQKVLSGDRQGHFSNVYLRPIPLAPQSQQRVCAFTCSGTLDEVQDMLAAFANTPAAQPEALPPAVQRFADSSPAGAAYRFSQRLLAATLVSNVVYPVYTRGRYIKHYTPGRWWDSLYTWDSGFIGLGLMELDRERAIDCLNAYVTEPGDPSAAFIHHGSMVPVQFALFHELWNRQPSPALLTHFYPRLRQYYRFFAGHAPASTTARLASGLLQTWDYFYNSGGWDDYPPQVAMHAAGMADRVAPILTSSHAIRCAKILRQAAASLLNIAPVTDEQSATLQADIAGYDADIARLRTAIEHGWDADAGYYGYVVHDEAGQPTSLLRDAQGVNYNMGLDGLYPLFGGEVTRTRAQRMIDLLQSPQHLWSRIGLSAVDQHAPYYAADGYWNGTVWMSHQWFYWKTMLDWGESDFAWRIASTALALWQTETGRTYHSFEHFQIETGRGAGWHQFGGLSSPLLNWFAAYYRPGTITTGLDVWVHARTLSEAADHLELSFSLASRQLPAATEPASDTHTDRNDDTCVIIACLNPDLRYQVHCGEVAVAVHERLPGVLELRLPRGHARYALRIVPDGSVF